MTTLDAERLYAEAIQCWQRGDPAKAEELLRAAIAQAPAAALYHASLGILLKELGQLMPRIVCYRRAVELSPEDPAYRANLAAALNELGDWAAAEDMARQSLALGAERAETWQILGNALRGQQAWQEAARTHERAAELKPDWPAPQLAAAQAWEKAGRMDRALVRYHQAIACARKNDDGALQKLAWQALGSLLARHSRPVDAERAYRQALDFDPQDLSLLTDLGNLLRMQHRLDEAHEIYRFVAERAPADPNAQGNLGTIYQSMGQYDAAITCYRATLARAPHLASMWTNLASCLNCAPNHAPEEVRAVLKQFDNELAQALNDSRPHENDRNPERPLRIGFVSPDFRRHAVAYFALPLLEGLDPERFHVFCYYNHRQSDEWTLRFEGLARGWVNCADWDDAMLTERIRADGIDILVDLAGHTEGNRLLSFARKPAPVQVTWMGYVTTSGLSAMDWRITHADADPDGSEGYYSEKLWRLAGTMWCYRPLPDMPDVAAPPHQRKGYITFGSFNRFAKISRSVLEAWAEILRQTGNSRLLICIPEGAARQRLADFFAEHDVDPGRIDCFAKLSHREFWAMHAEVDIALDPFPFGGGTTSCETLWLGVPVVTCTGGPESFAPRFSSRMGYAFLNSLGLAELAAGTEKEYVELAVALAKDSRRLIDLRQNMRSRMASAPLTDEKRFVKDMEAAYRAMWQEWCANPI